MNRVSYLLAIFCMVAYSSTIFAQGKGFYVQPTVGYQLPATNEIAPGTIVTTDAAGNSVTTAIKNSYGQSMELDLELGYFINSNIAFNLVVGGNVLSKKTLVEQRSFPNALDKSTAQNRRMTLSPGITVDAGMEKISPYARFGLLLPAAGKTTGVRTSDACETVAGAACALVPQLQGFESFEAQSETKGRFGLGFNAVLGARYELNDMASVFVALNYTGLRIKRKSYTVTSATVTKEDGTVEDVLPLLGLNGVRQYTIYKDEIDPAKYDEYKAIAGAELGSEKYPAWERTEDANFSTFGINLGARFLFGSNGTKGE